MTDTDRDPARLPEFGAGKPVQRDMGWKATSTPLGGVEAPHGQKIPSRSTATADERIASAVRSATYASRIIGIGRLAGRDSVAEVIDEERTAFRDLIASLEGQLAEANNKIAALSQPRVFTLSGVVEADLAERYESLSSKYEAVLRDISEAKRAIESLKRQLADVTTDRDALREIIGRKDKRIDDIHSDAVNARREVVEINLRNDRQAASIKDLQQEVANKFAEVASLWDRIETLEEERDAAAENARRERDQHAATVASLDWVQEAFEAGDLPPTYWGMPRGEALRQWTRDLGREVERLKLIDGSRPRCRVVTSPRFYSDVEREVATDALWLHLRPSGVGGRQRCRVMVDGVAEALGMRRAQS